MRAASPSQFLSVEETAQRLGWCQATVRRQAKRGALASKRCGRKILIPCSALRGGERRRGAGRGPKGARAMTPGPVAPARNTSSRISSGPWPCEL